MVEKACPKNKYPRYLNVSTQSESRLTRLLSFCANIMGLIELKSS